MEVALTRTLEALIMPPSGPLLLAALGLVLHWRGWRHGRRLAAAAFVLLYLLALPPIAGALLRGLERYPALTEQQIRHSGAGVIVVLGAGRYAGAPEYGGDTASAYALERLRYGAWLQRHTRLPLLVTGGAPFGETEAEADFSARLLQQEFASGEVWTEGKSRTTGENARLTAQLLEEKGIRRILLVTHAWHMVRSVPVFESAGLEVIPAPTVFTTDSPNSPWLQALLPAAGALNDSTIALHEYLGRLWYRIRY